MSCGSTTCTSSTFIAPGSSLGADWARSNPLPGWIALALHMHDRWRQRRRLLELDDRMLADIGLSRQDALDEARKPFWRWAARGNRGDQP